MVSIEEIKADIKRKQIEREEAVRRIHAEIEKKIKAIEDYRRNYRKGLEK